MVAEQHFYLCTLFEHNEYTTIYHQVGYYTLSVLWSSFQYVYYLDSTIHLCIFGHVNQQSILCQHGVKSSNCILTGLSKLGIVF